MLGSSRGLAHEKDIPALSPIAKSAANAGLALVGKWISGVDKKVGLEVAESIIFGTLTNSPLLGLGMAINMGISQHSSVYTIKDLYNDIFGKIRYLIWR